MRRTKLFALLLAVSLLTFLPQLAYSDSFLYGVQVFNRPIDWYWNNVPSLEAGKAMVREMIEHAAELGFDIIRGGSQYNNMYSQVTYDGEHDMWGMKALLPMLAEKNLKLDWVIAGTDSNVTNPPELGQWEELTRRGASIVASIPNQPEVIYEIWNEPDLTNAYWDGTLSQYYDVYLPAASRAIRQAHNGARIINGGLVLGNNASDAGQYLSRAINMLNNGEISMLAIHAHDPFYRFMSLIESENISGRVHDISKVFLNEIGYAWDTEGGKAFNTTAKLLGAKALGFGGAVVFHMGGLTDGLFSDQMEKDSQLIRRENNSVGGRLIFNDEYYAVGAAIQYTKGLELASSRGTPDEGYVWLFRSSDGRKKTLVCVGRSPTDGEVAGAFGSESYDRLDIFGDIITAGFAPGRYDIMYLVSDSGDDEPTPEPELEPISILTTQSDIDSMECKVGKSYRLKLESEPSSVSWGIESGKIPDGLNLSAGGIISGVPTKAGAYEFVVIASLDGWEASSKDLVITVKSEDVPVKSDDVPPVTGTIRILTSRLDSAKVGTTYDVTLQSEPSGAKWSTADTLPDGLVLESSGRLHGTPRLQGNYAFNVRASKEGWNSSSVSLSLTVSSSGGTPTPGDNPSEDVPPAPVEPLTPVVQPPSPPDIPSASNGKFGESYRLVPNSGAAGVTYVLDEGSRLPKGLSLNENIGIISGVPEEFGEFVLYVHTEKDGLSSESTRITITIDPKGRIIIITTQNNVSSCVTGSWYELPLETHPASVTWSLESGILPPGLELEDDGVIQGFPNRSGMYEVVLLAELDGWESASRSLVLTVSTEEPSPNVQHVTGGSHGGGGCDSGFGLIALVLVFLKRR